MKVHIIIISYNRQPLLKRCLLSLKHINPWQAQAYVLINGHDPQSTFMSSRLAENSIVPIKLYQGARQSLSAARNFLLNQLSEEISSNDWILFLDDDAYLPENFGRKAIEVTNRARKIKAEIIGAPNLTPPESSFSQQLTGEWLGSFVATGPISRRYHRGPNLEKIVHNDHGLILCNLWLSAAALKEELFLETIKGGEENFYFYRFFSSLGKAIYSSELFVYHERREKLVGFFQQIYKYGFGRGQVFKNNKNPQWVYFTPLTFFFALGASSIWSSELFASLVFLYMGVIFFESWRLAFKIRDLRVLFSIIGIPTIHILYSVGLILGWKDFRFFSHDPSQIKAIMLENPTVRKD